MNKSRSVAWITIFLILVVVPGFTHFFGGQYVCSGNNENRNMASKPIFAIENYEEFPKAYETYYNDNLPFRNQLIRFHNSVDYFCFQQSSNEKVVIGKEGWLFYCINTYENPIEQSLGYWNFTNEQLRKIADNLLSTKRILDSLGIEFVLFIAPNKETIYIDKLPDYYEVKSHSTSTDQLVKYLMENTDVRIVYPKQDLLYAREENPDILLYHKLDTHWNNAGAYIGAKSLARELGIEMPLLSEVAMEPILYSGGDLAGMLNIKIKDGEMDYKISGINTLSTINDKWDFDKEMVFHTAGADSRKLFVQRDSFSSSLAPSLATQFENSMWVHSRNFNQQQIFDYDADIYVLEIVERSEMELEEGFRISFISSSVEIDENEVKRIILEPVISKANFPYISLSKGGNGMEDLETIQTLEPFREGIILNVPRYETGKIYIDIFADQWGEELLEKAIVEY